MSIGIHLGSNEEWSILHASDNFTSYVLGIQEAMVPVLLLPEVSTAIGTAFGGFSFRVWMV